jgi:MFS family permease
MSAQEKRDPIRNKDVKSNFGKKGWFVVIYGICLFMMYMSWENGLNYIVPAFSEQLGVSTTILYSASTFSLAAGCIALLLFGYVCRKRGPKVPLITGLIISVVGLAIWGTASNTTMYFVGVILNGFGTVTYCNTGLGALVANWFPTKKGMVMGWVTMGIVAASLISNMVINPSITYLGLTATLCIGSGFGVILVIVTLLAIKNSPEEAGAHPDNDMTMTDDKVKKLNALGNAYRQTSPWNSIVKCLRSPAVWACGAINGLLLMIVRGIMSQMVSAMVSFGYSQDFAAMIMTVSGIITFLFSYLGGVLDQKAGTKNACAICCFGAAAGCLVFSFFGTNIAALLIALVIFGFSSSAGNNYSVSLVSEIFGRYDFDTPYSVIIVICNLISSIGFTMVASIANSYSYATTYLVCAGFAALAGVIAVVYKGKFEGRDAVDEKELDKAYQALMAGSHVSDIMDDQRLA